MKFSFFSFQWLGSEERKQKKEELELKQKELDFKKEKLPQFDTIKEHPLQQEWVQQTLQAPTKPFKSCRLLGDTIMVVLNDGTTLSKEGGELLGKVRQAQSEEEILQLFITTHYEKHDGSEGKFNKELVMKNLDILRGNEDFLIEGDNVYIKEINLALPPIVLASFIELCERAAIIYNGTKEGEELVEQYEALKMFWSWAALNPIEESRESLLEFVRKNDITITTNGLLLMYRRVVKKESVNHELVQFVSNQYAKLKKWKKSPANYEVWKNGSIYRCSEDKHIADWGERIGNLEALYLDLPNIQEDSYTDGHTHTKDIRVGAIYKEDEDKINLDRGVSCGSGLHVGSKSFGFSGFGDVGVIALVNPIYVRSVPNHECEKMRVSEMFIAAVAELNEYEELVEDGEILDYSNVYCKESLEELEQMLKEKRIDRISCQDSLPAISIIDVDKIRKMLKARIVNI